jgi:hypothetical protein
VASGDPHEAVLGRFEHQPFPPEEPPPSPPLEPDPLLEPVVAPLLLEVLLELELELLEVEPSVTWAPPEPPLLPPQAAALVIPAMPARTMRKDRTFHQ